jgi:hypothetical protein
MYEDLITGLAKRFYEEHGRLYFERGVIPAGDRKPFDPSSVDGEVLIEACRKITEEFIDTIDHIANMPNYDQDDAFRLRHIAKTTLENMQRELITRHEISSSYWYE